MAKRESGLPKAIGQILLRMASASLHALMLQLVDYAGLFPPAKLDMTRAVATFARHRAGPHAFGLSRFIVSCSRLEEFSEASAKYLAALPDTADSAPPEPWAVSVLIDGKLEDNLASIERFNNAHECHNGNGHNHAHNAVVDTVEIKVTTAETIDYALDRLPEELYPFIEIPLDGDIRGFATCLAGRGAGAKIRTGGVVAEAIPSAELVAEFISIMNAAEVPIKATAGLHHPVRAVQALTYEPASPTGMMHGFLNVFLGAALLHQNRLTVKQLVEMLQDQNADSIRFTDTTASWRDKSISTSELQEARENFAICFGSCSFDDPTNDLAKLGLLK